LLINTSYKLFVNSANMTKHNIYQHKRLSNWHRFLQTRCRLPFLSSSQQCKALAQSTDFNHGQSFTISSSTAVVLRKAALLCLRQLAQTHRHTTILRPFFRNHPGEPVPEEDIWSLWCKGRLTEAHIDHSAGRHSIRTNQCPPPPSPIFTRRMPFLPPNQQCQSTEGLAHSD